MTPYACSWPNFSVNASWYMDPCTYLHTYIVACTFQTQSRVWRRSFWPWRRVLLHRDRSHGGDSHTDVCWDVHLVTPAERVRGYGGSHGYQSATTGSRLSKEGKLDCFISEKELGTHMYNVNLLYHITLEVPDLHHVKWVVDEWSHIQRRFWSL